MIEKVILKTRLKTSLGKIVELFLSMLFILFREQFFFFKRRKKKVSNLEDGSNVLRNNVANIGFIRFEEGSRFQEAPPPSTESPEFQGAYYEANNTLSTRGGSPLELQIHGCTRHAPWALNSVSV